MRMMETIRRRGQWFLWSFLFIFTITLFFGLTGGFNGPIGGRKSPSPMNKAAKAPELVQDGKLKGTAMLVNGRPVSDSVFDQTYKYVMEDFHRQGAGSDSPEIALYGYGRTANTLVGQEVIMAKGEELGVKLTDEDLRKAKTDAAAAYMGKQAGNSGNVVGDLMGKLGDIRDQKAAFDKYLQTTGMTEEEWERSAHRSLYTTKVHDELQKKADADKKAKIDKTKAEVDAELAKGTSFADVVKKYSEGPNKENGGDMDWLGRKLVDKKVADVMMATPAGKLSEWIEIPAGWQRFEVLEKKEAKGAEFDKAKPDLVKAIQTEKKQADYKPTDDELKDQYEKARVRVIELHTTDESGVNDQITALIDSAVVQVNNPYALAFQALYDSKLQPPASMDYDGLVKLAKSAPVGDAYDFSLIKTKLAAGVPKAKPEDKKDDAAKDADKAAADAAKDAKDEVKTPIYALAIGLLNTAIETAGNGQGDYPYYMASKAYIDWLKDDENAKAQPVQRDKARAELDKLLERVVKSNDYSATAHAWRGLNLAWMEKKTDAEAELAKAMEYAPSEEGEVWQDIRKGYEVLDNKAKVSEVDAKLGQFRQDQIRKMIEQAQQQQQTGKGNLIKVPNN